MESAAASVELFRFLATRTAAEMGRAFACYYPVEGNNDVAEAVTATYFGFQLRDQGFFVYPQVQCSGTIDNHLDLATVNPASSTVLPRLPTLEDEVAPLDFATICGCSICCDLATCSSASARSSSTVCSWLCAEKSSASNMNFNSMREVR